MASLRSLALVAFSAFASMTVSEELTDAQLADIKETVRKYKEGTYPRHIEERNPIARRFRQKVDEENEYIERNRIEFTKEMKEKRKKEFNEVLEEILRKRSEWAYDKVMSKRGKQPKQQQPQQEQQQQGQEQQQKQQGQGQGISIRDVQALSDKEGMSGVNSRETLRRNLNTHARRHYSDEEIEDIHHRMQEGLSKKVREEQQRRSLMNGKQQRGA